MIKIVLLENDDFLRLFFEKEISKMGHSVICAKDGCETLNVCQREKPDLVVVDLNLPDMDGLELMRKLFKMSPTLPVILNSASRKLKNKSRGYTTRQRFENSMNIERLKDSISKAIPSEVQYTPQ